MGGLVLECLDGHVSFAVAGGGFGITMGNEKFSSWTTATLKAGETLTIQPGEWGNWAYLAFSGDVQSQTWLGKATTHSLSNLGGGVLSTGQTFDINNSRKIDHIKGNIPLPSFARPNNFVPVVLGPQQDCFNQNSLKNFLHHEFKVTPAYDRMGMRLFGPDLKPKRTLSIISEPIIRGSIQVAGDGVATALLADHQTTGGYPKIATIISSEIDKFTQIRPGNSFIFQQIRPDEAIEHTRAHQKQISEYFTNLNSYFH